MNEFLKNRAWDILSVNPCIRYFLKRLEYSVTILMYHGVVNDSEKVHAWTLVKASEFEQQIKFLKRHFEIISLDDMLLNSKRLGGDKRPKAIITFDDGLSNNLSIALPLLERYNIPATVYISTEAVQKNTLFWWDKIIEAIFKTQIEKLDLNAYILGTYNFQHGTSPKFLWGEIQKLLENMKFLEPEVRQEVADKIAPSGVWEKNLENSPFKPLTPNEVSALAGSNLITIGSHSHCHNILTRIPLPQAKNSIHTSVELLKDWTGQEISHFSFPNGNYNRELLKVVKKSGFKTAVTTIRGRWQKGSSLYEIKRIGVGGYDGFPYFKSKLSGGTDRLKNLIGRN